MTAKRLIKQLMALVCVFTIAAASMPSLGAVSTVDAASSTIFYEGFGGSSSLPQGWTAYDADGDGRGWGVDSNGYNGYPTSGYCVYSTSALSWSSYLTPDDWLVTPAITLPDTVEADYELSFQIMTSYMTGYTDYIQVYVSTEPDAYENGDCVLDATYYTGYDYQQMTVDLNAYRGQTVYVAFRHHTATGLWQMYMDDVAVTAKEPTRYRVKLPTSDVCTVTPQSGSEYVISGQDYAFTVDVNEDCFPENGTLTVAVNGETLTPTDGVYTIACVTEKKTVTVDFAYAIGDVNGDAAVNTFDALMLYRGMAGAAALNSAQLAAGNIDTYAACNMMDAISLFAYVSGSRAYIDTYKDMNFLWKSDYVDMTNGVASRYVLERAEYYLDGCEVNDFSASASNRDGKVIFYTKTNARVVNLADGYAVTLPTTELDADYSLSELRSHYESDGFVLNISREHQNPYGNTAGGWNTYLTEWLNRYIADDTFLANNDIKRTRASSSSTTKLSGYTVLTYDLCIEDAQEIDMPYYSIAVIRKNNEYVNFYLLVMKSTTKQTAAMDTIVKSFKEVTAVGEAKNTAVAYDCENADEWNEETTAYYEKLMTQDSTDWGFFSYSMVDSGDSSYSYQSSRIASEYNRLSSALAYDYEIMPTYTHIGWGSDTSEFPLEMAQTYAGGNGFNGKPVLQFTYQFTTSNNTNLAGYTPMFDVARGEYDEQFRRLARDIKAYGAPVLFRLNNEMNTDWTSYGGIVTLLDPDIFIMTWERLYEIFLEEGVDNCIWIFNPIATTTPYCDWGEYLCYLPNLDYVHVLGLTSYEMGNGSTLRSFEDHYRTLYEKNTPYFDNYPWIISEFAAGAGGEKLYNWNTSSYDSTTLGRNEAQQAKWVEDMFECFSHRTESGYEFCKNIKGAVWFSCNDYATIGSRNYITNYLALDDNLDQTLAAFKKGLAAE